MPSRFFTSGRKFSTTTSAFFTMRKKRREPLLRLQVQRDGALVAVQVLEVRTLARTARRLSGHQLGRLLDLDDIGAPVGELAHAGRPRPDLGQVENGKAFERARSPWESAFSAPVEAIFRGVFPDPGGRGRAGQTFPDLAGVVYRGTARGIGSACDGRPPSLPSRQWPESLRPARCKKCRPALRQRHGVNP